MSKNHRYESKDFDDSFIYDSEEEKALRREKMAKKKSHKKDKDYEKKYGEREDRWN